MSFTLKSPAFGEGQEIPKKYSMEGENLSPPLEWSGLPPGTRELLLICEDPDAPGQPSPFLHWLAYHISSEVDALPEGLPQDEQVQAPLRLRQALNSFGESGYGGPLPPKGHGFHRYYFRLYALDESVKLGPESSRDEFLNFISGHTLGECELMGRYARGERPGHASAHP